MDKNYNPQYIEKLLYQEWNQCGYFKPNNDITLGNYCIMMPPPNITGSLHMGHAFQQTIMDILIRYKRMQGNNTLWQVGTDHAGIATQVVVENKIIIEEGKTRFNYNRDFLIDKILLWKRKYNKIITSQIKRLGNSVYWENERFTMDRGFSNAVKIAFINLYHDNLIYRGKCLVNWDIKLNTAISDLEIINYNCKGYIWYLRYILSDGVIFNNVNYLIIATTRPETIFGDSAIAVNSNDIRYKKLIGCFVYVPLIGRRIPIISDNYVNIKKGSGCLKLTPAHDFNDYKIGKFNNLLMINMFNFNGNIRKKTEIFNINGDISNNYCNKIPYIFQGLERFNARKLIINEFKRYGIFIYVKLYEYNIPYSDRSNSIVEPMLTNQWYLRAKLLVNQAIEVVKKGYIKFIPKKYERIYFNWMNNIQDWCISRQIWWGHRIPAWYDINNKIYVGYDELDVRKKYNLSSNFLLKQDSDVLDTWFSSSLWTFVSLGWPNNTFLLKTFHPTDLIVSGFDIIFFWIARMIMLTIYLVKDKNGKFQIPFKDVYITGLVLDDQGVKMSKSKGNVIDPLDIINGISLTNLLKKRNKNLLKPNLINEINKRTIKQFPNGIKSYGADALRITLASLASPGCDINWDMNRLEGYRNFCNKLWNASRFILFHTKNFIYDPDFNKKLLFLPDRWIILKFNKIVKIFSELLNKYRFDLAVHVLYEFIRNQFCDWYLESSKFVIFNKISNNLYGTQYTLLTILELLLRLSHPIIPYITETIWQRVKTILKISNTTIMLQHFPVYNNLLVYNNDIIYFKWIKKFVILIRSVRLDMNIKSSQLFDIILYNSTKNIGFFVNKYYDFIINFAKIKKIIFLTTNDVKPLSIVKLIDGAELLIPIKHLFDIKNESFRLINQILFINIKINFLIIKLSNFNFINKAPLIIVNKENIKLNNYIKIKIKLFKQFDLIFYS
ncbi:MAG: valine--tRNA ligase [gamma proteobacterium endosymbiont of Trioza apicalis]